MKYKKIILPLLGTISISAPIATLIACSETNKIPDYLTDENLSLTNNGLFTNLKKLSQSDAKTLPAFASNVFESIINSEKNGFNKDIVRLQDLSGTAIKFMSKEAVNIGALVDTNVVTPSGSKQSITPTVAFPAMAYEFKGSNAFWTKHFTKNDISKPGFYNDTSDELNAIVSGNKSLKFGLYVVQDKEDAETTTGSGVYDSGEYTAYLFALKQNPSNSLSDEASAMFKDTNKFEVNVDGIKQRWGSYILGNSYKAFHGPQDQAQLQQSIWGSTTTTSTSDDSAKTYMDRTVENHLGSWYGFGESKNNTMSDADKAKFDELWTIGAPVQDLKTKEWFLSLTSYQLDKNDSTVISSPMPGVMAAKDALNISSTLIPMPILNNFASNATYTKTQMQNIIENSVSFERAYSFVNKVLQNVGMLSLANTAIPYLDDLSKNLAFMYQVKPLLRDSNFFDELTTYLKIADPNFDMQSFVSMLDSFTNKPDYDFVAWGAKRIQLLHYLPRFYKDAKQFVSLNKNWESKLLTLEDTSHVTTTK